MTMLDKIAAQGVKLTPMMQQYHTIKKNYSDTILFFRMGDFYEVFFEDAQDCAKLLNITLTHRGKLGDTPIPMAGMPHHSASSYIDRLTGMGKKVAICEQTQDPKDAKGIVERAVTQVVSPGIPYCMDQAMKNEHQFICAGSYIDGHYYLAAIDFTTGDFLGHKLESEELFLEKIRFYNPKEFIQSMGQWDETPAQSDLPTLLGHLETLTTHLSEEYFEEKYTKAYIESLIPAYQSDKTLRKDEAVLGPIGALSYYICSTQGEQNFFHIKPFKLMSAHGGLKATTATLRGLEILPRTKEGYKNSLLGFFNKTMTAPGARFLKNAFQNPLGNAKEIAARQEVVGYFVAENDIHEQLRADLSDIRDIERIQAKLATNKATASDLINIKNS
jgi:DNA mismatch repair protein MutS